MITRQNRSRTAVERRNSLVEAHLGLVSPIARRLARSLPKAFEFEDLCATGNVGLVLAADRYCPANWHGTPFAAFAVKVIRGTILDSLRRGAFFEAKFSAMADEPGECQAIETTLDSGRLALRVSDAVGQLPRRLRSVVRLRLQDVKLIPIGKRFGVGAARVSQLHAEAIRELRTRLASA